MYPRELNEQKRSQVADEDYMSNIEQKFKQNKRRRGQDDFVVPSSDSDAYSGCARTRIYLCTRNLPHLSIARTSEEMCFSV